MSIRKRFLLLGSLLLGAALLGTSSPLFVPKALAASDNNGEHICWGANGTGYCMDLKDDTFQNGQEVYLWSAVDGTAHGLGWNLAPQVEVNGTHGYPFTVDSLDTRYNGDEAYWLEKTTATGHNGCIGVDPSTQYLAWFNCGLPTTLWVYSAFGYLVNVDLSDSKAAPQAAAVCTSVGDGTHISLGDPLLPGGNCTGPWNAFPV
jgi:hypothetical protein